MGIVCNLGRLRADANLARKLGMNSRKGRSSWLLGPPRPPLELPLGRLERDLHLSPPGPRFDAASATDRRGQK